MPIRDGYEVHCHEPTSQIAPKGQFLRQGNNDDRAQGPLPTQAVIHCAGETGHADPGNRPRLPGFQAGPNEEDHDADGDGLRRACPAEIAVKTSITEKQGGRRDQCQRVKRIKAGRERASDQRDPDQCEPRTQKGSEADQPAPVVLRRAMAEKNGDRRAKKIKANPNARRKIAPTREWNAPERAGPGTRGCPAKSRQ